MRGRATGFVGAMRHSIFSARSLSGDTLSLKVNQSATIDVLANDTSNGALNRSTLAIVVAPTHGTATITASTYSVSYQPAAGHSGLDTFQYTVQDNLGTLSKTATVSIDISPPPASGGGGELDEWVIAALSTIGLLKLIRDHGRRLGVQHVNRAS